MMATIMNGYFASKSSSICPGADGFTVAMLPRGT